jgi:hypothetical protein
MPDQPRVTFNREPIFDDMPTPLPAQLVKRIGWVEDRLNEAWNRINEADDQEEKS